jgi:PAS domain S-box-containing protein
MTERETLCPGSQGRALDLDEAHKAAATLAAIIESSDDAIVGKTIDGIVTSWNRGAERLFGYRADEMIGRPMMTLLAPGQEQQELDILKRIARGETIEHFEAQRRHKGGHLIDVSVTISPIRDAAGRVIGASKIARDITEAKQAAQFVRANEKLAAALSAAEAESRAKGQFLANMSHEIRTPMNAVLGFVGLALEAELSDTVRHQLQTAHNSAKSLLLLINDILDLAKLHSGKITLEMIEFSLPNLLRDTLNMLQIKAEEKKLRLEFSYDLALDDNFRGDPTRIRQILVNLIGNALKFTESGTVMVSVSAVPESKLIRITISDTGIGMTTEQAARIFQPFTQADDSTSRRYSGTGLGLTISAQLVELMGGTIQVESEAGKGSRFHATLQLEPTPDMLPVSDDARANDAMFQSSRRLRVLLVDDVEANLELGETRLRGQRHDVTVARNGSEAVALFRQDAFDVILMDVHMPVMDGIDATREIRKMECRTGPPLPIIALSASVLPAERGQCLEAGMSHFVSKPIDFAEVLRLMEIVVPGANPTAGVPSGSPGISDLRMELMQALDSDDPDEIEPVLGRVSARLVPADADRLRELVSEFDFVQARSLVMIMSIPSSI